MGNNLIDRQAVFDAIAASLNQSGGRYTNAELNMWGLFMQMIQDLPSAQPERKRGRWIPQNHNKVNGMASTAVYYYPKCSVCGHCANCTNFCPNCGADMRGERYE